MLQGQMIQRRDTERAGKRRSSLLSLLPVLLLSIVVGVSAVAGVVRSAPDVSWQGGRLSRVRGQQPVVLVIAKSPKDKAFKKQAKWLRECFQQFSARQTLFVVAFVE